MNTRHTLQRWWPLALLFAASMGLRWFHLGSQSLSPDEGVSWVVARLSLGDIMGVSEFDHHTPLYLFLLKLASTVLPSTEAGVRTLSVVASAAALIAVLAFLKTEWSLSAAVYAGLLMTLSSFDLFYAQDTRMYALLATAWIISYIALVKALQGKSRWLVVWAIAMIAMPWTQLYGFLVIGANAVFVIGYLIAKRVYRFTSALDDRLLVVALAAIGVGTLPMARVLLSYADTNSMGGLVPQVTDLRDLYLLWTVGLVAVRQGSADSAHLTLPITADLSPAVWFLAGTIVCGAPAVYGLVRAWRLNGTRRLEAGLASVSILLPVAITFCYSVVMGTRIWIQRPFLGAAYLMYLWAGIGLAAARWQKLRWALAALAVVLAAASIIPYFTMWQKSDGAQALQSMPYADEHNALVLEVRFLASQARFYLGPDAPLLALDENEKGMPVVVKPIFDQGHSYAKVMGHPSPTTCDNLAAVTDLWLYGKNQRIRRALPQLPGCVTEKRLWLFEKGRWTQLDSFPRNTIDTSGWLQFDTIRNNSWTTEAYKPLSPGDGIRVILKRANKGNHRLTVRYYDAPQKILEVWAAGQLIGQLGDGHMGGGWVEETLDLPATAEDKMAIEIKSTGAGEARVANVSVTLAD